MLSNDDSSECVGVSVKVEGGLDWIKMRRWTMYLGVLRNDYVIS